MFELTDEMLLLAKTTTNSHQAVNTAPARKMEKVPEFNQDDLNKLQGKILKARLNSNVAQLSQLEDEYKVETRKIEFNKNVDIHNLALVAGLDSSDASLTLSTLVQLEKQTILNVYDSSMTKAVMSSKSKNLDELDERLDSNPTIKKRKKKHHINNKPSQEQQRIDASLNNCLFCYTSERIPNVSVVALGSKVYLGLTDTIDLVPGHCIISTSQHIQSTLECEDDTWDEIRNFMKCLIKMFAKKNMGVVFMEQSINAHRKRHAVIECIPMPNEHFQDAPAFFKVFFKLFLF